MSEDTEEDSAASKAQLLLRAAAADPALIARTAALPRRRGRIHAQREAAAMADLVTDGT